jgi:ankyrin repeat protein
MALVGKTATGLCPLNEACRAKGKSALENEKREEFITYLVEKSPQINAAHNQTGWRCIHWLSLHGDTNLVRLFLQKGAYPHMPEYSGYFPVDIAG